MLVAAAHQRVSATIAAVSNNIIEITKYHQPPTHVALCPARGPGRDCAWSRASEVREARGTASCRLCLATLVSSLTAYDVIDGAR